MRERREVRFRWVESEALAVPPSTGVWQAGRWGKEKEEVKTE